MSSSSTDSGLNLLQDQALENLFNQYHPVARPPVDPFELDLTAETASPIQKEELEPPKPQVTQRKPKKPKKETPEPIVRDQPVKPKKPLDKVLVFGLSVAITVAIFILFLLFSNYRDQKNTVTTENDIFPLSLEQIRVPCTKIEHFSNIKTSLYWTKLFKSFDTHMNNPEQQLNGLSSFYMGEAFCYLRVRSNDGIVMEMFNPKIIGHSENSKLYYEQSIQCQKLFEIPTRRPSSITVKYQDIYGVWMISNLQNIDAAIVSQLIANLQGKSICDGTDKGIETMS